MNTPHKVLNNVQSQGLLAFYSSFTKNDSSSRIAMLSSQLPQAVVLNNAEIPFCMHGFEKQLATKVFGERAPCNMHIRSVIPRINNAAELGIDNPLVTIVYENEDTGEINSMDIESYFSAHQTFGFKTQFAPGMQGLLTPGNMIPAGTIITESPNVKKGYYGPGRNLKVAYIPHEGTIEDGFTIAADIIEDTMPTAVGEKSFGFGSEYIPLNTYGDPNKPDEYKIMPGYGEKIRPDGLLVAFRKKNEKTAAFDLDPESLRHPDDHDLCIYVESKAAGATVYSIDIIDSEGQGDSQTIPPEMVSQLKDIGRQQSLYYDRIKRIEDDSLRINPNQRFGPQLSNKIVRALAEKPNSPEIWYGTSRKGKIRRKYRGSQLDEFRVTVKYHYDFELGKDAKATDMHGGKGVFCGILPREHMPVDDFGNRADVLIYFRSGMARLNTGQFYEQYINGWYECIAKDCAKLLSAGKEKEAKNLLLEAWKIISPPMYEEHQKTGSEKELSMILKNIAFNGDRYLHIPADNTWVDLKMVDRTEQLRPVDISPVTFVNMHGQTVRTDAPVLIAAKYMIILEKSDSKPMACSGPRRNHYGSPAPLNKRTKWSTPTSEQPARVISEDDGREFTAVTNIGPHIQDMANNQASYREGVRTIMRSHDPANIEKPIDRDKYPIGYARNIGFVKHSLEVTGVQIEKVEGK